MERIATGAVHDIFSIGIAIINVADVALLVFLIAYLVVAWQASSADGQLPTAG